MKGAENALAAVKSPLHISDFHQPGYQLLQRQPNTRLAVAPSNLMSTFGRHIWLSKAIYPTQKADLDAESLTWHNQEVLIGKVYRLDWAQVSPMRHQAGPELPGELGKWEGNTIKCQRQLNYKCIKSSLLLAYLLQKDLRKVAANHFA